MQLFVPERAHLQGGGKQKPAPSLRCRTTQLPTTNICKGDYVCVYIASLLLVNYVVLRPQALTRLILISEEFWKVFSRRILHCVRILITSQPHQHLKLPWRKFTTSKQTLSTRRSHISPKNGTRVLCRCGLLFWLFFGKCVFKYLTDFTPRQLGLIDGFWQFFLHLA